MSTAIVKMSEVKIVNNYCNSEKNLSIYVMKLLVILKIASLASYSRGLQTF